MKLLKRLYDWVLHWAYTPYGTWALLINAFAEASFFPVPPDVLLMALSVSRPRRAFLYASLCTAGSTIGGAFGFFLGYKFWSLAQGIIFNYITPETFDSVRQYFIQYEAWAIAIAGFTPVPYKVFTISAGFFRVDFFIFIIASLVSRGARFFLVGGLMYLFGERIKEFIDRYFNLLTLIFMGLLIGGFILLKVL